MKTQVNKHLDNSLALMGDGSVRAWGRNSHGEVGDGTTTMRSSPVAVSGLASGVRAIAAGFYHSLAVQTSTVPAPAHSGSQRE